MVDAVDARPSGALNRFGGSTVASHLVAPVMGHCNALGQLVLPHRDDFSPRMTNEFVAGNIELHVVDAFPAADPDRLADTVDAIGDHAEALGVHVLLALVTQAAGNRDLRPGRPVTRPGQVAVLDLLPDDHVDPELCRGGGITAGESVIENERRVPAGPQQVFLGWNFTKVLVACRTDKGKVAVTLNHARHQELAVAVDHVQGTLLVDGLGATGHCRYAIVLDEDLTRIGFIIHPVPDCEIPK